MGSGGSGDGDNSGGSDGYGCDGVGQQAAEAAWMAAHAAIVAEV